MSVSAFTGEMPVGDVHTAAEGLMMRLEVLIMDHLADHDMASMRASSAEEDNYTIINRLSGGRLASRESKLFAALEGMHGNRDRASAAYRKHMRQFGRERAALGKIVRKASATDQYGEQVRAARENRAVMAETAARRLQEAASLQQLRHDLAQTMEILAIGRKHGVEAVFVRNMDFGADDAAAITVAVTSLQAAGQSITKQLGPTLVHREMGLESLPSLQGWLADDRMR